MSCIGAYQKHIRIPRSERFETASDKQCAVCLENVKLTDDIFWPTCGHFGHEACISQLPSCAVCRKAYSRAAQSGPDRVYELVRSAAPAILDALARYRERLAHVVDDDDFDERVCDVPIRIFEDGRERDVHLTVWITAYGVVCELVDEIHRRRLQLSGFVPIEGGLLPDAAACEHAIQLLARYASVGLQLSGVELRGRA